MSKAIETVIGFDYGNKKIGIATGQTLTKSANALKTIASPKASRNWNPITEIINEWQPDALIVGVPVHMDGTEIELTKEARRFAQSLQGRYNKPVFLVDERLSSVEAAQEIASERAAGIRKKTVKGDIDKLAASIILQTWFNQKS